LDDAIWQAIRDLTLVREVAMAIALEIKGVSRTVDVRPIAAFRTGVLIFWNLVALACWH
jgi:hypothetical protein